MAVELKDKYIVRDDLAIARARLVSEQFGYAWVYNDAGTMRIFAGNAQWDAPAQNPGGRMRHLATWVDGVKAPPEGAAGPAPPTEEEMGCGTSGSTAVK